MKQLEMAKWLKGLTLFTGAIGLILLTMVIPILLGQLFVVQDQIGQYTKFFNIFVWITAIPVYIALYKIWKICTNIAGNNSFCPANAKYLKDISCLAIVDTALYLFCALISIVLLEVDILAILLLICTTGGGIFIAVVAVALSHLTTKACVIKQENDLTI